MQSAKDKLIVALDVDSAERALAMCERLTGVVGMFKVGLQLFTAAGPDLVRQIVGRGARVFLDLKLHDIPNTVAAASIEATRLGVSIFNVHASGGVEMMKRTLGVVAETAAREGLTKPKVVAVTVLTSLGSNDLQAIGFDAKPDAAVLRLASLAADCGMDGVVASPLEVRKVRDVIAKPNFLIITPGIRRAPAGDDQQRIMTAAQAIAAGADYIVVGRPILNAADPAATAQSVVSEIGKALDQATAAV